jgi:hypothetical protein
MDPKWRRDLPVYVRSNGFLLGDKRELHYKDGDACLVDKDNNSIWKYCGKKHKGVGVVACIRSGTQYISRVMHKIGLNVGHERQAPDGSVGYHLMVIRPDNCFHQVRHPLKQISSNVAHNSWGFCDLIIDLPNAGLLGCMKYWYEWNLLCEEFCVWRYRIEEFPEVWDEFLERIGHEPCELPDTPTDTNKQPGEFKQYTWDDLFNEDKGLAEDIVKMAKRYGYDVPEMDKAKYQNLGELETAQVAPV